MSTLQEVKKRILSIEKTKKITNAMQMVAGGQQQTSGMEQIALVMGNIKQVTTQSIDSTRQAEKAAQELDDLARSLAEIVAQYQL